MPETGENAMERCRTGNNSLRAEAGLGFGILAFMIYMFFVVLVLAQLS